MRTGNLQESVLKRSVLKQISHKSCKEREWKIVEGPAVGNDAAVIRPDDAPSCLAIHSDSIVGNWSTTGTFAVERALANVVCAQAQPYGILVDIVLPAPGEESALKGIMRQISDTCRQYGIKILGGHTEVSRYVMKPVISVTAIASKQEETGIQKAQPGMDLVLTKWIALGGSVILAEHRKEKLSQYFTPQYIHNISRLEQAVSVMPEASVLQSRKSVYGLHDLAYGGVFAALWQFSVANQVGIDVVLEQIPIQQETVELCELLEVNPYQLESTGSLLFATDDAKSVCEALWKEGIPATVIGKTTGDHNKILRHRHEEEIRHLEPPAADELFRMEIF
ncbi:MAG: AIR synthase related protein [Lachnospiraceae bacterium]